VIARIVDESAFDEFKPLYGATLVTGFAHTGVTRGIFANNGILFSERRKGRAFHAKFAQKTIPAIFLQKHHRLHGGAPNMNAADRQGRAKMVTAVATAAVPKFTVIIGGSFGAGNYGCADALIRALSVDVANAASAVMGGEQPRASLSRSARRAQGARRSWTLTRKSVQAPIREQYERQGNPLYPARGFGTMA